MDTIDNNGSHLPARLPATSPHLPAMSAPNRASYELAPAAPSVQISPQGILRGLTRNWWRILLLWAAVTAPLLYGIYVAFGPTYEAVSTLRVEPTQISLYDAVNSGTQPIERIIETQMTQIQSNQVLMDALALPAVNQLPFIKNSTDKLADLRQKLKVVNRNKTTVVQVSFESPDPKEAADIVNAVVDSYLVTYKNLGLGRGENHQKRVKAYLETLRQDRESKIRELTRLVDKGTVDAKDISTTTSKGADNKPTEVDSTKKDAADEESRVSLDQYRAFKADIIRKQLETEELRYALQKKMEAQDNPETEAPETTSQASLKPQRDARINELFQSDASVARLMADIADTDDELQHTKNVARRTVDPARKAAEKHKAQLMAKYQKLWEERYDQLLKQVMAEEAAAAVAASGSKTPAVDALPIDVLKMQLQRSEYQLGALKKAVEEMDVERKAKQSDTFAAEVLRADIDTLADQWRRINEKYEDLKFASGSGTAGVDVELQDRAIAPAAPTSNKRTRFMILAPGMVLCLVLGLFALLEVKAERVADPDALSTRVQSEVYSLPPLPMVRASNKLGGPGDDDQIDRFIQRLDHLRFALCGDHPDVGLGRCVLITSAIGGEGKTTLAAQLAARCGHAGHSTLLIDADLRRGSLCPLLDVPEGLGLSDVLKEEANAEDVVIPVQGGTFHLLCAGTPVSDTSRIFQGRNFGMLIARLRQSYDLIIIDSPPVLPVPDGLILGRWTDGAVLASRYEVSRAPQVERARRQLNNAGIPVLGTVINGMKSADSYYGRYSYSRGRSGFSESNGSTES